MKSAPGQVWYWPSTDEVILILTMRFVKSIDDDGCIDNRYLFDELNLETGQVWRDSPRSIEDDDRWERLA